MAKKKNEIVHIKKQAESQSPVLILNTGKPRRPDYKDLKLTVKNRKIVLESLLEEFNLAKAAAKVNVTYNAIRDLINRDEDFAASVEQVKEAWSENLVGIGLKVASFPSREGHADRKLFLEAYRQKEFGRKLDVNVTAKVTHETAIPKILDTLDRFGYAAGGKREIAPNDIEDAEFVEISAPDQS